ncbi:PAS domain-containing sensor histidine kinase [Chitinophaga lutea]
MEKDGFGFEAIFNHATLGIIISDDRGRIVKVNPFLLRQFGYEEAELAGREVEILIPARYGRRHVHHRNKFHEHPHSRPMGMGLDLFAVRKDGSEFPVEISLGTYEVAGKQFVVAFVSDISLRKQSETALRELNAQLEKKVEERTESLSARMQEIEQKDGELRKALQKEKELNELKSRFVSMASHEFRTPLSTVLSSVFLVSKYERTEDQPKREKHVQRIVSAVNLLTDILNDFLSVGKIEEGKIVVRPSEFNIEQHAAAIVQEMQLLVKERQTLGYTHTGAATVTLDPGLLKHIVLNLVSNAIKFTPPGGAIDVKTEVKGDILTLRVEDTGIGIPEADQAHLFERFFRATNVADIQGTGLGLHIVAKYAELMHGEVACENRASGGTAFVLTFKLNEPYEDDPAH